MKRQPCDSVDTLSRSTCRYRKKRMVQNISTVPGFRSLPTDKKGVPTPTAPPPRNFVRGGSNGLKTAPVPHSTSVHASQDAEAKKIQALFMQMNPGKSHSVHAAQFMLNGKPATISGTKDELTITGDGFEIKIDHGELSSVKGIPGSLQCYRTLLELDNALQLHNGLGGVWPKTTGRATTNDMPSGVTARS